MVVHTCLIVAFGVACAQAAVTSFDELIRIGKSNQATIEVVQGNYTALLTSLVGTGPDPAAPCAEFTDTCEPKFSNGMCAATYAGWLVDLAGSPVPDIIKCKLGKLFPTIPENLQVFDYDSIVLGSNSSNSTNDQALFDEAKAAAHSYWNATQVKLFEPMKEMSDAVVGLLPGGKDGVLASYAPTLFELATGFPFPTSEWIAEADTTERADALMYDKCDKWAIDLCTATPCQNPCVPKTEAVFTASSGACVAFPADPKCPKDSSGSHAVVSSLAMSAVIVAVVL